MVLLANTPHTPQLLADSAAGWLTVMFCWRLTTLYGLHGIHLLKPLL
jgi:hypothetical protein